MEKETSCINSRAILDYMKAHYQGKYSVILDDLHPEIDALPDPENFLRDPHNWISCQVASELYKRARVLLDDEMAAFNIARYAFENASLGYAQRIIVKTFWSIKKLIKSAQRINDKWNRNKKIEIVEIKGNTAVMRLRWDPTMDSSKDICLYNQGAYTCMPLSWGGKPIDLTEKYCYFNGDPYCEYHIRWSARNRLYEIFSSVFTPKSVLQETIREMEEDKKIIEEKYDEVNRLNLELNYKYKQLMAIQDTGKAILSVLDLGQLLTVIMNILANTCRIHRAIIMLVNAPEGVLEYIHGVGFDGEAPDQVKNYKVPLDRLSNILARVANTGHPEYVPEVKSSTLRKENIMLTFGRPSSVYVFPLITRSKIIGVIATDAVALEGVPKETRETLEIFAPQIAIAIENARLYSQLQEQMQELKRSHALLNRTEKFSFLGNLAARLAHEIKNPMTAIGTFMQMLPQKFDDLEFRKDFHKVAMEETNRVNSLINELLDLVKTKESNFEFDNLHNLIEKMVLLISPQSNAKKVDVTRRFDSSIGQVWMDNEKMKQTILNLLSNAVEFTPEGGTIEFVTKNHIVKGKPSIRIQIKDNGFGIPKNMIDKIFDPYFTTKHKSSIHNGTGLGLFIAHQNMQDHNGTIDVKSKVNEGTVFTLTLPVVKPS